jgi:predicted secreted protein
MRRNFGRSNSFCVVAAMLVLTSHGATAVAAEFQVELSGGQDARIAVRAGDVVTLTLPIQAVTGHSWILTASLPKGLELVGQRREPVQPGTIGGAQRQIDQLRANEPGRYPLSYVYRRSWLAPLAGDPVSSITITAE